MSPEKPRIAGELRLRVASSDDPACFENGSDLLRTDGQPWTRPLYSLSKHYLLLYDKLREERLVPDDLDTALSTLPSKTPQFSRTHLSYTLNDTFIVDFSSIGLDLLVVTKQGVEKVKFHRLFSDRRGKWKDGPKSPYTGARSNYHLSILLYWFFSWICRKCLGSIRTFDTPKPQRHKDHCATLSQDNHTCEVRHSRLRWLHICPKGGGWRASPPGV